MFLFILESIGTSELILIGIIALIFLGPRKLPQIAKTIGKTMADFRNTTTEFKSTWQREVDFEEEISALRTGDLPEPARAPVPRGADTVTETETTMAPPDIRPVQTDLFDDVRRIETPEDKDDVPAEEALSDKRSWL